MHSPLRLNGKRYIQDIYRICYIGKRFSHSQENLNLDFFYSDPLSSKKPVNFSFQRYSYNHTFKDLLGSFFKGRQCVSLFGCIWLNSTLSLANKIISKLIFKFGVFGKPVEQNLRYKLSIEIFQLAVQEKNRFSISTMVFS